MNRHFDGLVTDRSLELRNPVPSDEDSAKGWLQLKYAGFAAMAVVAVILGVLAAQVAADMVTTTANQVLLSFQYRMGFGR